MIPRENSSAGLWLGLLLTTQAILFLANKHVHADQQQQQEQQQEPPARQGKSFSKLELKFQSEPGGNSSIIIKRLGQQQVFKCQVRLAPVPASASQQQHNSQRDRIKSSSRFLSSSSSAAPNETAAATATTYASQEQPSSVWDGAAILATLPPASATKFNVSSLTIDWLKDGLPLGGSLAAERAEISVVNVTLKMQQQQRASFDKITKGAHRRPRLEIKNTLNGQQLKLTSRLRVSQMKASDSGQFSCVARARVTYETPIQAQTQSRSLGPPSIELVEQSLESTSANLIVLAQSPSKDSVVETSKSGNSGSNQVTRASNAMAERDQMQARHNLGGDTFQSGADDEARQDALASGQGDRSSAPARTLGPTGRATSTAGLFEDDEDLFGLDPSELISGAGSAAGPQQELLPNDNEQEQQITTSNLAAAPNNDESNGLLVGLAGAGHHHRRAQPQQQQQQHEVHLDWILDSDNAEAEVPAALSSSSAVVAAAAAAAADEDGTPTADRTFGVQEPDSVGGVAQSGQRKPATAANEFQKMDDGKGGLVSGGDDGRAGARDGFLSPPLRSHSKGASLERTASGAAALTNGEEGLAQRAFATLATLSLDHRRADDGNKQIEEAKHFDHHHHQQHQGARQPQQQQQTTSARSRLAKLVHKIVPESSCYTGLGELYRGNVTHSSDQRVCLNWMQVRLALSTASIISVGNSSSSSSSGSNKHKNVSTSNQSGRRRDDHNYCRNPNNDPRGPWCFVAYSEHLDGAILMPLGQLSVGRGQYVSAGGASRSSVSQLKKLITQKQRVVRVGFDRSTAATGQATAPLYVVAGPCSQIASCSEYLWLYVVAPPLGLLVLLTCLGSLAIRSIRKSRCNAIFSSAASGVSAYQRQRSSGGSSGECGISLESSKAKSKAANASALSFGLGGLITSRSLTTHSRKPQLSAAAMLRIGAKKLAASPRAVARRSNYLDNEGADESNDDIFEIVDDIDWTDGRAATALERTGASASTSTNSPSQSMMRSLRSPTTSDSLNLHSTASDCSSSPLLLVQGHKTATAARAPKELALMARENRRPLVPLLAHSKSTMLNEQALDLQLSRRQQQQQQASILAGSNHDQDARGGKMSKSRSQAGPMFATLRCHVRNTQQQRSAIAAESNNGQHRPHGRQLAQAKKSSSFIENQYSNEHAQVDPDKRKPGKTSDTCNGWMAAAAGLSSINPNLSSLQADFQQQQQQQQNHCYQDLELPASSSSSSSSSSAAKTGHLISCVSSSSSSGSASGTLALINSTTGKSSAINNNNNNKSAEEQQQQRCDDDDDDDQRLTLASELPQLDASSVTLAYGETQAIYEGKFSQVQMAYLRQDERDLAQATGRIGAQVALCSLKQQAALDESVYYARNLRLHHLNHLNIIKLMGYVQSPSSSPDDMERRLESTSGPRVTCSLVYDMAHLIDLSDWLKEQCKDAIEAQNDEISGDLSLRQNLTCIAKQIALALDYLHDKKLVYKDLACRNCFLDVTRMLVKLASFNVEPEFVSQDESPAYGHAGVPSPGESGANKNNNNNSNDDGDNSSQELTSKKLSLKSMVRPKYLLDYYVIDSRPSECQLLPLSWIPLESILFNKFNKHTDIWSFGCLLYELFSLGEVAYFGYSSKQVIDSVRSNMMPPQPLLCPNGIYKLMCKCLSDIPTLRPSIKHVYEQLNLYSGQCSSFLNHHLCMI